MLIESGTISISGAQDDGIQVELSSDPQTGTTASHEDENSGNFYMTAGKLTIASGYQGKAIKADGSIKLTGGTRNFDTAETMEYADIEGIEMTPQETTDAVYDLQGRKAGAHTRGIVVNKQGKKTVIR